MRHSILTNSLLATLLRLLQRQKCAALSISVMLLLSIPVVATAQSAPTLASGEFADFVNFTLGMLLPIALLSIAPLLWSWMLRKQVALRTSELRRELNERQQAEAALRESESRLRDVTEAASDWIWEMDAQLRYTYLSERFCALTGIATAHVLGQTRWELAALDTAQHPEKWREHRANLENHQAFRDFIYSINSNTHSEQRRYVKVSGKPIYDQQQCFIGYRGTGRDITEQTQAEAALQKSELRLRRIIDLVPHMIFAKDRNGNFLLANQATAAAYGLTVKELIANGARSSIAEEAALVLADDQAVIDSGTTKMGSEEVFTDHAGQVHIMQTIKIPFDEPGRNETAVLGVAIDITEQKRAKEEVARMRLYLKNIIDSMPSMLVGVDPWGYITVLNQPAEQACGVSWEVAQGQFFGKLFPQLENQFEQVREAIRLGNPIKTPRMILEAQGERHYADVMVYPLTADSANGAVIRVDDVTARVRIESMMVQTEKMLSVGGLAAGMAHEINNPLGAILQGSQNILRRVALDMPQNHAVANAIGIDLEQLNRYLEQRRILHFLDGIREAGARAAKIVSDMLSFSRCSASRFAPAEVEELLETALRLAAIDYELKKRYDFQRITIERDYDPHLGSVLCDTTEIEQVVLNLLKNATQAMAEEHHPCPTITLRTRREDEYALIEVADNGPGIEDKHLKRIFEPFFTTKDVGLGTGLGLSVSYFIITEQHRGKLTVTSKFGHGTCFSIRLPLKRGMDLCFISDPSGDSLCE